MASSCQSSPTAIRTWLQTQRIETAGLFGAWSYVWSLRAYSDGAALASRLSPA